MASTIITGAPAGRVIPFMRPLIERKANWEADWALEPELELLGCVAHASSTAVSSCTLQRRYGNVKAAWEPGFSTRVPMDYAGHWIRVSLPSDQMGGGDGDDGTDDGKPVVIFLGIIEAPATQMAGMTGADLETPDGELVASGTQIWTAAGGLRLLEKMSISQAVFGGVALQTVDWLPHLNMRDAEGTLVGNRSAALLGDTYAYDGGPDADVWTHLQYLQYLLKNFVQQTDDDDNPAGPTWTIGGQSDILAGLKTTIRFPESVTAAAMLRLLIPVRYGIDFFVRPLAPRSDGSHEGFEIFVFALTGTDNAVAGVSMPANPNQLEIVKADQGDFVKAHLVESSQKRYDKIRVVGKRILVCGSLRAQDGSLIPKWSEAQEAAYAADTDTNRASEIYSAVYQQYGIPEKWDMAASGWAVGCDDAGNLTNSGPFQNSIRKTHAELPLQVGVDYSTNPPTDKTLAGHQPAMQKSQAWVYDTNPSASFKTGMDATARTPGLRGADTVGLHVIAPKLDWGVELSASPNHLLAIGSAFQASYPAGTMRFDTSQMAATVAIESDSRLRLEYALPEQLAAGDGSVLTEVVEEAEAWALLSGTIVDVKNGALVTAPDFLELRNDKDRLALVLAGMISRYLQDRIKGQFVFKGHEPWLYLLGAILTVFQQGSVKTPVGAPVTSIQWTMGASPETTVSVGYA